MPAGRLVLAAGPAALPGKIYWLGVPGEPDGYVGSTVQTLQQRRAVHVCMATYPECQRRKVVARFNAVGWERVEMRLLEAYACASREELRRREALWIEVLRPSLNMVRAYSSAEHRAEYVHRYNVTKSGAILRRPKACLRCGRHISTRNMARHVKLGHCSGVIRPSSHVST